MNRQQSKYFATAAKMDDAFLTLLEEKDFTFITVKEICARAGVNRSTFYLHYETIGDLLTETIEKVNREFLNHMRGNPRTLIAEIDTLPLDRLNFTQDRYLVPYLNFVKTNQALFCTAMERPEALDAKNAYRKMFEHVFNPILDRHKVPKTDRKYLMAFYLHGLMSIVEEWMKNDCAEPVEHIAKLMRHCVLPAAGGA